MKLARSLTMLIAGAALLVSSAVPVSAQTVEECQAQLGVLASATTGFQSADRLATKATAASTKLAEGKTDDALAKLADYRSTLAALADAPKPKVDPTTAQSLDALAADAETCIAGLSTTP